MNTVPTPTPVTADDARSAVEQAILRIVPDADLAAIPDDVPFRPELELDSLDFLSFVELLSKATQVRIDEEDYPSLTTFASCVRFLTAGGRATG
jgi:acyl carrier protein